MDNEQILELVESLQSMMIDQARGVARSQREYAEIRTTLMENSDIKPLLPRWVRVHGTLTGFEGYIKSLYSHYKERSDAIIEAFKPTIAKLSGEYVIPMDSVVAEMLDLPKLEHIQDTWKRALGRIQEEPDAAITSARSLVESVCKSILEVAGENEENFKKLPLPRLFDRTWDELNKQQEQKSLENIKVKIRDLVTEMGSLRNELGDAHGRGPSHSPPTQLEAELAVNLAGTITLLLIRRWKNNTIVG